MSTKLVPFSFLNKISKLVFYDDKKDRENRL